jgi:predicted GIY-YIG superfamily endonuclease
VNREKNYAKLLQDATPLLTAGKGEIAKSARPESIVLQSSCKKLKSKNRKKAPDFHHCVYVVLLDDAVANHPSVLKVNPKRDSKMPCVYVGLTGLTVEERFANHQAGHKSAWAVKKYGIRLLPELFEYLNPMPYEDAARMEKDLTADLRSQGYTVTGGT